MTCFLNAARSLKRDNVAWALFVAANIYFSVSFVNLTLSRAVRLRCLLGALLRAAFLSLRSTVSPCPFVLTFFRRLSQPRNPLCDGIYRS